MANSNWELWQKFLLSTSDSEKRLEWSQNIYYKGMCLSATVFCSK